MLPFPVFAHVAPTSVSAAVAAIASPGARVVAGGTDLLPSMKHRLFEPTLLVSTRRIAGLRDVGRADVGGMWLGSGLTLREVSRLPEVKAEYPGLVAACRSVATPTIQAMATLGGNVLLDTRCMYYNQPQGWREALGGCLKKDGSVCHVAPRGRGCYATCSADTVPTLVLLGAEVELVSTRAVRRVPVAELYREDGIAPIRMEPDELLTRVWLPRSAGATVHRKLRPRQAIDYAQLLVAAGGQKGAYTVVLGAVTSSPVRVSGADAEAVAEAAWRAVQPLATQLSAATWRKKMVRVETRRAVEALGS